MIQKRMEAALLIDIGSTFTKVCAVDLLEEEIVATACTPSTTNTNVTEGINNAFLLLNNAIRDKIDYKIRCASSSAAGGLRLVVVGLVPELTVKAGKLSAYNAGAKIVGNFSYKLNQFELIEIEELNPDILLFVGGTDGGNEEILLWNAKMIAQLKINVPIIFAGNKEVAGEVKGILKANDKSVFLSKNVLSHINKINTFAVKEMIRKLFIERIILSKGISEAGKLVDEDIIPTPLAVFNAIKLLSSGTDTVDGVGELIAIDVGGATTDVYSSASGNPTTEGTTLKGIPLPYDMRTVEGDLGMRINAKTTLNEARKNEVVRSPEIEQKRIDSVVEKFSEDVAFKPQKEFEKKVDLEIASYAIQLALKRHAGFLDKQYTPIGEINIQYGKDLTNIETVVCTGGVFSNTDDKELLEMMGKSFRHEYTPFSLMPRNPKYFIDNEYILYGMGLLSNRYPSIAVRILKKNLKSISNKCSIVKN